MTDQFDSELRDRLAGLAASVPIEAPETTTVVKPRMRSGALGGRFPLSGLVPLLAIVVIGTALAGVAVVGPFSPGASEANGPVVSTTSDGAFELILRSAKSLYTTDEPIEIEGSLIFRGAEPSIEISHAAGARGGPLGFGIEEPVLGDLYLGTGWDLMCARSTLEAGVPMAVPFQKGGGWSSDNPRSEEYRAYMSDPVLRLSAGRWHVFAVAEFQIGDCNAEAETVELRVDLSIEVHQAATAASDDPEPTNAAQSVTVIDGHFELTLRSGKTRYSPDEAIDVRASLVYRGPKQTVDIWPTAIEIGSRERRGEIFVGAITTQACYRSTLERDVPLNFAIRTSRVTSESILIEPVPRLPEGTWHLYGVASASCASEPDAERFTLEAELGIEVTGESQVVQSSPAPIASAAPDTSPGVIQPDGSVVDEVEDGSFAVRIKAPESVYSADAPIEISTMFAYLGPESDFDSYHFGPSIAFSIEQLDATNPQVAATILDALCVSTKMPRGVYHDAPINHVARVTGDGVDVNWKDGHLEGPILRLPAGDWRITATFAPTHGACSNPLGARALQASIDIKVVPRGEAEIVLRTALRPTNLCPAAMGGGRLSPNASTGIGVTSLSGGEASPVTWPYGFAARRESDGVVLLGADGEVVAHEGDVVAWMGYMLDHGYACSGIRVVEP